MGRRRGGAQRQALSCAIMYKRAGWGRVRKSFLSYDRHGGGFKPGKR